MDKVECLNCGNIILYDFEVITCSLVKIRKNMFTNKENRILSCLDLFDNTINCCNNPDYTHIE